MPLRGAALEHLAGAALAVIDILLRSVIIYE